VVQGWPKALVLGERPEARPDFCHLRLVVLHVLVGMLGVPVAEQTRVLIDGDVDAAAGDVIGDLIAWLPGPAGGRRELVRRCGTPGTCGDLVAVGLERVTEGLRPREEPRRHASPREVLEPAVDDASDFLAPVQEQQPDDLLDEASLERLEAARPESRA